MLRLKDLITADDAQKLFRQLQNVQPKVVEDKIQFKGADWAKHGLEGKYPLIVNVKEQYQFLTRYWMDQCMAVCKFKKNDTPAEYWHKNSVQIIQDAKGDKLAAYNLWQERARWCSQFKPTVLMAVARMFGSRRILDPCAGWGDRLLAAAALNAESYLGTDPSECNSSGYDEIIRFTGVDSSKFHVQKSRFEDADLGDYSADLVFTSPPYFDIENYAGEQLSSEDEWTQEFLIPMCSKAWDHLEDGGVMAINIGSWHSTDMYVRKMIEANNLLPNAEYMGTIAYTFAHAYKKNPQPIFVWRKKTRAKQIDAKKFDSIRFQKTENKVQIERAFEIVKNFIISHKRLLAGGMSVDFALRLKGTKLYADDVLPDYDFLSPESWKDGYELAQQLCRAGLPTVDVIGAMHVTTQRVRVMGTVVADITYAPPTVFNSMRRLDYGGLYLLHPWYTVLDQFTALGMPYENPPHEVILERWKKDIKRMDLLLTYYPLEKPPLETKELHTLKLPDPGHFVLQGWGALAYYDGQTGDECKIPQPYLTLMTDDYKKWATDDAKYMNSMMGFPRHFETPTMHVYDTLGLKIGVLSGTNVVSLPALMWYFMHRWLRYGDHIDHMGAIRTLEHIKSGKWKLNIDTYGEHVWNLAFVHYMKSFFSPEERRSKPPMLSLPSGKCDPKIPTWDPSESVYFQIDGKPSEDPWTLQFDLNDITIKS